MTVPPESVSPGKCFVTPAYQVRRVLMLEAGKVTYEARGSKWVNGAWLWRNVVNLGRYAHSVSREVPCDCNPASGS